MRNSFTENGFSQACTLSLALLSFQTGHFCLGVVNGLGWVMSATGRVAQARLQLLAQASSYFGLSSSCEYKCIPHAQQAYLLLTL